MPRRRSARKRRDSRSQALEWYVRRTLAPPQFLENSGQPELQRYPVHTIALAGRRRAVVEDMAEVPTTAVAVDCRAGDADDKIGRDADRAFDWDGEARPAGAAVIFGSRTEQGLAAAGANEDPLAMLVVKRAGAGALSRLVAKHGVSGGAQPLSPFGVAQFKREALFCAGRFRHAGKDHANACQACAAQPFPTSDCH